MPCAFTTPRDKQISVIFIYQLSHTLMFIYEPYTYSQQHPVVESTLIFPP